MSWGSMRTAALLAIAVLGLGAKATQLVDTKTGNCKARQVDAVVSEPCVPNRAAQQVIMSPVVVNGVTYYTWQLGGAYVGTRAAQTVGQQTKVYLGTAIGSSTADEYLFRPYQAAAGSLTWQWESKAWPGRCVNTEADSTAAGAKVEVWPCSGAGSKELARREYVQPLGVGATRPGYPITNGTTLGKYTGTRVAVGAACACDGGSYVSGAMCQVAGTNLAATCRPTAGLRLAWLDAPSATVRATGTITVATAASVTGSLASGSQLTGAPATFSNFTGTVVNEWLRGGTVVGSGTTYALTDADVDAKLTFRSTADTASSSVTTAAVVSPAAVTGFAEAGVWTTQTGFTTAAFGAGQDVLTFSTGAAPDLAELDGGSTVVWAPSTTYTVVVSGTQGASGRIKWFSADLATTYSTGWVSTGSRYTITLPASISTTYEQIGIKGPALTDGYVRFEVFRGTTLLAGSTLVEAGTVAGGGGSTGGGSTGGGSTGGTTTGPVDPLSIVLSPVATTYPTNNYWSTSVGRYTGVNNVWGVAGLAAGWSQQVGLSTLQADGSVAWRAKWNFPTTCCGKEVLTYPEVAMGRSASFAPVGDAPLPKLASAITSLKTQITSVVGNWTGQGHLVYDLWFGTTAASLGTPERRVEVMLPVLPVGCYGVPATWEAAGAGRTGSNVCSTPNSGRNPSIRLGRFTIGGAQYDVYHANPCGATWFTGPSGCAAWTEKWHFVVLVPMVFPGAGPHSIEWKPIIDFIVSQGWASASNFVNTVELGYEVIQGQGDMTVSGVKMLANETTTVQTPAQPAYALPASPTAFSAAATSGPIVATTGQVIEGKRISNPTGACITVPDGVHGVVIRNNDIGPCGETTTSANLLDWANDVGVLIAGYDVLVAGNTIHDVRAGVYAQGAEHPIVVDRNLVWGIRGPEPRGEMVQLNTVVATGAAPYSATGGPQSKVTNNVSDKTIDLGDTGYRNPSTKANLLGRRTGYVDHVNLFGSLGTAANPILVACNKMRGGDDVSGSGMIVGDNGGGWVVARDNIFVMTTNVGGVGCAGCTDTVVQRNIVYAPGADAASNTSGAFYSKTDDGTFASARVSFLDNRAYVRSWLYGGTGELSAAWYEDGTTTGLSLVGNNFQDSTLSAAIWDTTPAACPAN